MRQSEMSVTVSVDGEPNRQLLRDMCSEYGLIRSPIHAPALRGPHDAELLGAPAEKEGHPA